MEIFTIGHSVHTKETFLEMLHGAGIEVLADVRAFPGSRKFPQFKQSQMSEWLPKAGVGYQYFPLLGGRRNKSTLVQSELNAGWENQSFHNYADYTLSEAFSEGIRKLEQLAKEYRVVCCCAERHPARCHRLIISNWLSAHEWKVSHILPDKEKSFTVVTHQLGQWGASPVLEADKTVVYPE